MTLQSALDSALTNNQRGITVVPADHGTASIKIAQSNPLACELQEISYAPHSPAHRTSDRLKLAADELVLKLRYLSEPLELIECDADAQAAQLRSSPPRRDAERDKIAYFECIVRPHEVSLVRIERGEDGSRQTVPFKLTRETLLQAIGDIDQVFKLSAARS